MIRYMAMSRYSDLGRTPLILGIKNYHPPGIGYIHSQHKGGSEIKTSEKNKS